MTPRILIAGIGNIFMGDDAFGCEVVSALARRELPDKVQVTDFGIRSYDLAFALTESYDAVVLVDAVPRGGTPGTTYLLELDVNELPKLETEMPDAHSLNPVSVLQLAQSLGGVRAKLFLVGCEPAVLEAENIGLSVPVCAAVPQAIVMIEELVSEFLGDRTRLAPSVSHPRGTLGVREETELFENGQALELTGEGAGQDTRGACSPILKGETV